MKTYSFTVPAGEEKRLLVVGTFVKFISLTAGLLLRAESVRRSETLCDGLEVEGGDKVGFPQRFELLVLKNAGSVEVTGELIAGVGDHVSTILTAETTIRQATPTSVEGGDAPIAPGATYNENAYDGQDIAFWMVQLDPDEAGPVRVHKNSKSDASVAANGMKVNPGETLKFPYGTGIKVHNPHGSSSVTARIFVFGFGLPT